MDVKFRRQYSDHLVVIEVKMRDKWEFKENVQMENEKKLASKRHRASYMGEVKELLGRTAPSFSLELYSPAISFK